MKLDLIKNPSALLRVSLGLIFLAAGTFRLFVPQLALDEMTNLGMPALMVFPITAFEIVMGLALIFNRYLKYATGALILFLLFALIRAAVLGGFGLLAAAGELFVFNINPTDVFMHLFFLVVLLFLFLTTMKKDAQDVPGDSQKN
jgi:uncharacterized membrane protein YphA (DoxX/SURF4 family)